ncbi:MAG: glycosyltransferase family 4 protein [Candidatus Moranbacteria bacterium]|nr:glycosyltransferase family 4 protein [Candidatus Moranbacteria bacterium]
MRILLINKYHFLKGGAERAYFDAAKVLTDAGHEVAFFSTRDTKNFPTEWDAYFIRGAEYGESGQSIVEKLRLVGNILWNREAARNLDRLIDDFRPDVAHLHNIYHQLSPSVIRTLHRRHVPMVMTLHDYKLVSPNYSLFVRGKIWNHASGFRCIVDRCVKDSFAKSLVCVAERWLHALMRCYSLVDAFIAPSRFLAEKFSEFGFRHPISLISQPLVPFPERMDDSGIRKDRILCYGRISPEKGIEVLIEAIGLLWNKHDVRIVGSGEETYVESLRRKVLDLGLSASIAFTGPKYGHDLDAEIREANAVVIPSVWYENMPYVLLESLARGRVVIASDIGGMTERIENGVNGFLFRLGDSADLAQAIRTLDVADLRETRERARESVSDLVAERHGAELTALYSKLVETKNT